MFDMFGEIPETCFPSSRECLERMGFELVRGFRRGSALVNLFRHPDGECALEDPTGEADADVQFFDREADALCWLCSYGYVA